MEQQIRRKTVARSIQKVVIYPLSVSQLIFKI